MTYADPVVARIDLAPAVLDITPADFPASPVEHMDGVRVIVSTDTVYVFKEGNPEPSLYTEGRLDEYSGRNTTGYTATTADGRSFFFKRSSGCLCGSRIRSFRPFPQGLVQGPYATQ
jgi:hypothetical protein